MNLFGKAFEDAFGGAEEDARKKQVKARIGLFSPGGPLAQQLAMNSTVLIVNDTVFAHGGLLPRCTSLQIINSKPTHRPTHHKTFHPEL